MFNIFIYMITLWKYVLIFAIKIGNKIVLMELQNSVSGILLNQLELKNRSYE